MIENWHRFLLQFCVMPSKRYTELLCEIFHMAEPVLGSRWHTLETGVSCSTITSSCMQPLSLCTFRLPAKTESSRFIFRDHVCYYNAVNTTLCIQALKEHLYKNDKRVWWLSFFINFLEPWPRLSPQAMLIIEHIKPLTGRILVTGAGLGSCPFWTRRDAE